MNKTFIPLDNGDGDTTSHDEMKYEITEEYNQCMIKILKTDRS